MSYVSPHIDSMQDAYPWPKFHFVPWLQQSYVLISLACGNPHPRNQGSLPRSRRTSIPNHYSSVRVPHHLRRDHDPSNVQDRPRQAHIARQTVDASTPGGTLPYRQARDNRLRSRRRRKGPGRPRTRDGCPPRLVGDHWKYYARAESQIQSIQPVHWLGTCTARNGGRRGYGREL